MYGIISAASVRAQIQLNGGFYLKSQLIDKGIIKLQGFFMNENTVMETLRATDQQPANVTLVAIML